LTKDLEIVLAKNAKISYSISPVPNPDPLQAAIFKDWLRTTAKAPASINL
jgi:hypothetical protein